MKTNTLFRILVSLVAFILLLSGCGSSAPKTRTILLPYDISLEMVELPTGQLFGKYEVTQAQWRAVMGENPSETFALDNPVVNVSWDDCQRFIEKMNWMSATQKLGIQFRLPTSWEWELACMAGSVDGVCCLMDGTEITNEMLEDNTNLGEMVGRVRWLDDEVHPVGQKEPNAFGLHDMLGNVLEWLHNTPEEGARRYYIISPGETGALSRNKSDRDLGFRLCASTTSLENKPGASFL